MEIRGLSGTRHMLMFISERMKRVGDLATKLKFVYDDIKKTDEIKIYRDKFHLPDYEDINIIETGEDIIVYRKETEYVEDKEALVNVREHVLRDQESKFHIKEEELKRKEVSLENREDILKRQEAELKSKKEAEDKALEYLKKLKDELDDRRKELDKKEEEVNLKWERFKSKKITYFRSSKKRQIL